MGNRTRWRYGGGGRPRDEEEEEEEEVEKNDGRASKLCKFTSPLSNSTLAAASFAFFRVSFSVLTLLFFSRERIALSPQSSALLACQPAEDEQERARKTRS